MAQSILNHDPNGRDIQAFTLPNAASVALSVSTTSVSSAALPEGMYRFHTDVDCFVVLGSTATTSNMPFAVANSGEYFYVPENGIVSAITSTGTGTLTLTRMP